MNWLLGVTLLLINSTSMVGLDISKIRDCCTTPMEASTQCSVPGCSQTNVSTSVGLELDTPGLRFHSRDSSGSLYMNWTPKLCYQTQPELLPSIILRPLPLQYGNYSTVDPCGHQTSRSVQHQRNLRRGPLRRFFTRRQQEVGLSCGPIRRTFRMVASKRAG